MTFQKLLFPIYCTRKTFPHIGAYKIKLRSCRSNQRENIGLLEFRPCLPCVTLLVMFFVQSVTDQPQTGTSGVVRHVQNHTGSLSSNQPCGPPCCANTLAFGLIGSDHRVHTEWQWPLPGVHSIMMEKSAQPAEDKGCTLHAPSHFHSIYHHKQNSGVPSS